MYAICSWRHDIKAMRQQKEPLAIQHNGEALSNTLANK